MAGRWYNGYSPAERNAKGRAGVAGRKNGSVPLAEGPCSICGDPDAPVEPHSEDYSQPYQWTPPATYNLCRHCHRAKLHKRFSDPFGWLAYKAHVKRGGYGSDFKKPEIQREVKAFAEEARHGRIGELKFLRKRTEIGSEWWDALSVDPSILTAQTARPRS